MSRNVTILLAVHQSIMNNLVERTKSKDTDYEYLMSVSSGRVDKIVGLLQEMKQLAGLSLISDSISEFL